MLAPSIDPVLPHRRPSAQSSAAGAGAAGPFDFRHFLSSDGITVERRDVGIPGKRCHARRVTVALPGPTPYAARVVTMLRIYESSTAEYDARLRELSLRSAAVGDEIEAAARPVIAAVRARGAAAVREMTERFERRALTALELPRAEWDAMASQVAAPVRRALEHAAARIRAFHKRERYASFETVEGGVRV